MRTGDLAQVYTHEESMLRANETGADQPLSRIVFRLLTPIVSIAWAVEGVGVNLVNESGGTDIGLHNTLIKPSNHSTTQ